MGLEKGLFITLEGPEGSGKSTQVKKIAAYCRRRGIHVLVLREPGGTQIGEAIRDLLLHLRVKSMAPETELMLYLAARAQIVREKILPALQKGRVVVCDRFEDSTLAYQGFGRGLNAAKIHAASRLVRGTLQPDITFLLDIDSAEGLKRAGRRSISSARSRGRDGRVFADRMEKAPLAFHRRVRNGFLTLARRQKKRFRILDARQSPERVFKKIREVLDRVL